MDVRSVLTEALGYLLAALFPLPETLAVAGACTVFVAAAIHNRHRRPPAGPAASKKPAGTAGG